MVLVMIAQAATPDKLVAVAVAINGYMRWDYNLRLLSLFW